MKKLLFITASLAFGAALHATPVLPGGETPLQTIINSNISGMSLNVNTNQVANDMYWSSVGSSSAYLVIEIAGFADTNAFGIYEKGSPSNKIQLFAGSASGFSGPVSLTVPLPWTAFGFYMEDDPQGFTWYSDPSLNAGGQQDHFVTYGGQTGATFHGVNFDSNDYLFGIEDLNLGDQDYNDMVVLAQNISPSVPEASSSMALCGLGLCAIALLRRKLA